MPGPARARPRRGPRPALTRIVFTRDSIEWMSGATVGDLLAQVPGVYLWRGGFTGRPEPVNFQGAGRDARPSTISTGCRTSPRAWTASRSTRRCSRSASSSASRSSAGRGCSGSTSSPGGTTAWRPGRASASPAATDDFARYEGDLERRFPSGLGFGVAADYLDSPTASGTSSGYSNTQVWAQGSYVPSRRFGVQYQLIRSRPKRRAVHHRRTTPNDTIGLGLQGHAHRRPDPAGTAIAARTAPAPAWTSSTPARRGTARGSTSRPTRSAATLSLRAPTLSLGASGFHRTRWTPLDSAARWAGRRSRRSPRAPEGVLQHHFGGRSSNTSLLAAGLQPMRGVALTGTARLGDVVAAPSILTDTAQPLRDFEAQLGWNRDRLGLQVGVQPDVGVQSVRVRGLPRDPVARAVAGRGLAHGERARGAAPWLTLQSWYSDPEKGTVDGVPPTHSLTTATHPLEVPAPVSAAGSST